MKQEMSLAELDAIITTHESYWAQKESQMTNLTHMMKQNLFRNNLRPMIGDLSSDQIIIEPATAHSVIEGYMSNIYPKAPAIICGPDLKGKGNAEVVQAIANRFLYDQSEVIERSMAHALIYPFSFWKLALLPDGSVDSIIDQVDMRPVDPWDVVVDFDADKFENSRYVGHRYWMPIREARRRWDVKFRGKYKRDYLQTSAAQVDKGTPNTSNDMLSYIEVYEIYDLLSDELIFFSRDAERMDKVIEVVSPIPFRKYNGRPLVPLVPMYFYKGIDVPLQGQSTLHRLYDAIIELINLRTIWANGIRKESRQMIAVKGAMEDDAKALFNRNTDGAVLEVNLPPGIPLSQAVVPLPNQTLSPDFSVYESLIEKDLQSGSMLGAFTKGIATSATATEVAAITQYTSSELGKLARIRDRAIEMISEAYTGLISFLLLTGDEKETVTINGEPVTITASDFVGKFRFSAADQSSTPIGAALQRQNAVALLGPLTQLGVPKEKILDYLVKSFDLPSDFKAEIQESILPQGMSKNEASVSGPQNVNSPVDIGGGQVAQSIRDTMP